MRGTLGKGPAASRRFVMGRPRVDDTYALQGRQLTQVQVEKKIHG